MKTIVLIALACLLTLLNGRIFLIESTCDSAECHYSLMSHVKRFNSVVTCELDNTRNRVVSTITHRRPILPTGGLYSRAFTMTTEEIEIFDLERDFDTTTIYLKVGLTLAEVQNPLRCAQLPTDRKYFNRECKMQIVYYNTAQNLVLKRFHFSLTVRIPREARFDFVLHSREIIEYGCDCVIDARLKFNTEFYKGEQCQERIQLGASFIYGEYLCVRIFGADDLSSSSVYRIDSLSADYRTESGGRNTVDMLGVSQIRCSLQNTCVRGQIYIIIPMIYVGRLDFGTVVVLTDLKRMLIDEDEDRKPIGGEHGMGEFTIVDDPNGNYPISPGNVINELLEDLQYEVKFYKGASCGEEVTSETILTRREDICVGVFGKNIITTSSLFDVTALETIYTSSFLGTRIINVLSIAIIKRNLDGPNLPGQVYAIIPMMCIGRLKIRMVITLTGTRRALNDVPEIEEDLLPKEINIELSKSFEVTYPNWPSPPEDNSAGSKVVITEATCDLNDPIYTSYLMEYVRIFNPKIVCKEDKGMFVSIISHTKPLWDVGGLYARAFTATNGEKEIIDFTRTDDDNNIYLHTKLSLVDIQDTNRCKQIGADNKYINQECSMIIKYYNTAKNEVIKNYAFSLTMRIPKSENLEFLVACNPIFESGCDCVLDTKLTFETKVYRGDDCRHRIHAGSSLTYGEYVCFGIFGTDEVSKFSEFEVTFLSSTYSRSGQKDKVINALNFAIIKHSLYNVFSEGQVYIIVPIMSVGRLNFVTVVVLKDINKMLGDDEEEWKPKGAIVSLPGAFEVTDPYGEFIEESDLGSSMGVALTTLIALLAILL